MAGYPPGSGYGYGAPPAQPYGSNPYAPPPQPYGSTPSPYGAPSAPYAPPGEKPPKEGKENKHQQQHGGYGAAPPTAYPEPPPAYTSPFAALLPSTFPPGTDPTLVSCFQMADQDGSGFIDDKELQRALSSYNQSFSLRTVHLLMYLFTNTNTRKIGINSINPCNSLFSSFFFLQFFGCFVHGERDLKWVFLSLRRMENPGWRE